MPKIQSAKKALRQNARRRALNLARKKELKNVIRGFERLIKAKKTNEAEKQLSLAYKKLDKLAKVNFLKKGAADRLKSRLSKKLKKPKA